MACARINEISTSRCFTADSTSISLENFEFFKNDSLFYDSESEGQDENIDGKPLPTEQRKHEHIPSSDASKVDKRDEGRVTSPGQQMFRDGFMCRSENNGQKGPEDTWNSDSIGKQNTTDRGSTGSDYTESNGPQDMLDSCIPLRKTKPNQKPEIVQYTFDKCYRCKDLGNDSADLYSDYTEIPEVVHVDQRSEIRFMLTDAYSEHGSMNLVTSKAGHFIEVIKRDSKYPSMMKLKHNDKLLGINYQPVERYEHSIVIEMLKYTFHSASKESILLVVERQEPNGNKNILEISVRVKVITRVIFTCFQYHGLCMNNATRPCPVFVGVFQCRYNKKYIMACNKSKLSLVDAGNHDTLVDSMKRITIADPRFFVVAKTASDKSYFESLLFRGRYWTLEGNRLKLAERNNVDILTRPDSRFHFIRN